MGFPKSHFHQTLSLLAPVAMGRGFTEDRLRSIATGAVKAARKKFTDDAKEALRDLELSCEYPYFPLCLLVCLFLFACT